MEAWLVVMYFKMINANITVHLKEQPELFTTKRSCDESIQEARKRIEAAGFIPDRTICKKLTIKVPQ